MNLPSPPIFTAQDNPNTDPALLDQLSVSFETLHDALSSVQTSADLVDKPFVTPASGNADVQVANPLGGAKPTHIQVTNLRRADGAAITAAYSTTWAMTASGLLLSFIGLPASTKLFFTAKVE